MIRLTLRSLRAEALRMLLSALAVVLGVAFVAGTMMLRRRDAGRGVRAGRYLRPAHRPGCLLGRPERRCPRPWSTGSARSTGWPPPPVS